MGSILNPDDGNSFLDLVAARESRIFVDKTAFIGETNAVFNTDGRFLAVTRPRRFGKTVTAHMLLAYYSRAYEGRNVFAGCKIAESDSFASHLNRHDVLFIDMNSIRGRYRGYLKKIRRVQGVETLVDFLEYSVIRELRGQEAFAECLARNDIGNVGLLDALSALRNDLKARFVFIMDEWDLVYREYRHDVALQKAFIDLMAELFKSADGQACFSFVYFTGILPIKKYNSQSALNTFDEYNMLSPGNFACYFGFTEEEVAEVVQSSQCRISRQELRRWYEGYKIMGIEIYNPNSVVRAVTRNECISYWSGTSSNEEAVHLINLNFKGVKEDILSILEGQEILFSCGRFQNDMVNLKSRDDVLCLLVCLGYLGCRELEGGDDGIEPPTGSESEQSGPSGSAESSAAGTDKAAQTAADSAKNRRIAYVPNAEIRSVLLDIVREQDWYERMAVIERSESLLQAILNLDGGRVAELIQGIHNSPAVSLFDYNSESALTFCVITGLMWSTLDDYVCHREDQAGKGRVDLVYEPVVRGSVPLILIEFKFGESAEEALQQIRTQEYYRRYTRLHSRNTLLVGINYDPKTKEHQCLIEKLA